MRCDHKHFHVDRESGETIGSFSPDVVIIDNASLKPYIVSSELDKLEPFCRSTLEQSPCNASTSTLIRISFMNVFFAISRWIGVKCSIVKASAAPFADLCVSVDTNSGVRLSTLKIAQRIELRRHDSIGLFDEHNTTKPNRQLHSYADLSLCGFGIVESGMKRCSWTIC